MLFVLFVVSITFIVCFTEGVGETPGLETWVAWGADNWYDNSMAGGSPKTIP